jgi:hypothetical protein
MSTALVVALIGGIGAQGGSGSLHFSLADSGTWPPGGVPTTPPSFTKQ